MNLALRSKKILCRLIVRPSPKGPEFDEVLCEEMIEKGFADWLYRILGFFTYLYICALAIVYFGYIREEYLSPSLFAIDALQEPYLGALGIYVILKEMRKRRLQHPSRYLGELFVILWLVLLFAATAVSLISEKFVFDSVYKVIFTNSIASFIIFIGSKINKP